MNIEDCLKAAIPAPHIILGIRLRPLSLGSCFLLARFKNSFLLYPQITAEDAFRGEVLRLPDLLQGVLICSLEWDAAQAAMSDPDLAQDVALWAKRLRGPWWRRRSPAEFTRLIENACASFRAYMATGSKFPLTKAECGPDKPIGSPWFMFTLTALTEEMGLDFHVAMNQPLTFSRWLVASNGERKGHLEICERDEVKNLQTEADAIAREVFGEIKPPSHENTPPNAP